MKHLAMCAWCHATNNITGSGPHFCTACGHRSDRTRLACDCARCVRGEEDEATVVLPMPLWRYYDTRDEGN